jgi:hypothetical protein
VHALLDIIMILVTPCVTCLVIWRWCEDEPQNQDDDGEHEGEREPAADEDGVALAA